MVVELIIGASCFIGGIFFTSGLVGIYKYIKERREVRRRSQALYNHFIHLDNQNKHNSLQNRF